MTRLPRKVPQRRPHLIALAIAAALASPAALAQQAAASPPKDGPTAKDLDRIVVTAQKREQQIEDVPISISAYTGDFLQAQGINDYGDLGSLIPGLEIETQSVTNPSISIRGITADLDDPTQEPRISLFQDGVSISRARGSSVEMFDMQRIEVLRGPQGTLFGRAAEIGAIHFIQNKARPGTSGGFEFGAGSDDERKFTGFYNSDLGEGVQGRIAAFYESRDGYVENLDGGTLQGKDTRALRGSLHFDVGDRGDVDVILNYQHDTPPGTAFRSQVIPNTRGSLDPYVANNQRGKALGTDRDVYGVTVLGNFGLTDTWSLSSITGWRRYDSTDKFDSDGSQADLIEFDEYASGHQFSQELRLNYDNGGKFSGFVGGSWFDETAKRDLAYQADERQLYALFSPLLNAASGGLFPIVPLLNPDLSPNTSVDTLYLPTQGGPVPLPLNPDHRERFGNDVKIRSFDLFADGTWKFNDAWSLTLGVRATHENATYGYHADAGNGSALGYFISGRSVPICALPNPCTNLLYPATNGRISADGSWNSWVGRAVLGWRVSDTLNTYASISRGRRPNMINVNDLGSSEIPAEIVWSYEVGMKGNAMGGRFLYDLSAFYYDYTNFQASIQNPTPPPFFVTANAGKAHAYGVEASLFMRVTDQLAGWFNYGHIQGGFNAFDGNGVRQELAGNQFRMTPKNTLAVGMDWTIPLADGRSLYVRPGYTWRSGVYFEDANQPNLYQRGYGLLGLRVGMRFATHWDVSVWGDNLTDRKYLIDAGNTGLLFGIPTVIAGRDRSYGVTVRAKF